MPGGYWSEPNSWVGNVAAALGVDGTRFTVRLPGLKPARVDNEPTTLSVWSDAHGTEPYESRAGVADQLGRNRRTVNQITLALPVVA